MTSRPSPAARPGQPNIRLLSYLMGLISSALIFGLLFLVSGLLDQSPGLLKRLEDALSPAASYERVLRLPPEILAHLTRLDAVVGNANNPTGQPKHDTMLVQPDSELGYVLRPDVRLSVRMLRTTEPYNLDPPTLHLRAGANLGRFQGLEDYLRAETRLAYGYSTDRYGRRSTVPSVGSDRRLLVVGDSVAFGVGVDDENTAASHLQRLLGERYAVFNAGVGGYDGQQAFGMARRLSNERAYSGLIYIACQNDFMDRDDWVAEARDVLAKMQGLAERFDNKMIVILETYMEYNLRDFFLEKGWKNERIEKTDGLRRALPGMASRLGFEYRDWTEVVERFMRTERSIFSRFALYSDHVHLSPLGNRLMAQEIVQALGQAGTARAAGD